MKVAHLLRKYDPSEWGGTETALQRLFDGLEPAGVHNVVYAPRLNKAIAVDPLAETGCTIKRFSAMLPVIGVSREQRDQMIAVGGNLLSFDLIHSLWRESDVAVVHSHTLGRIGGVGLSVARTKKLPFVLTIHGGVLDLPESLKKSFEKGMPGWEWGKIFGWLLRARKVLSDADAVLTCNTREAALLQQQYPKKRIQVQPHGVQMGLFESDHRVAAREAFPQIVGKKVLLCVGRIDPVKNQSWLVDRCASIFLKHPDAVLVLAGACTDQAYGTALESTVRNAGLHSRVLLTGGLKPGDPRLIGLYQEAAVVLLPSISETFGLVLLEAWAAGKPVMSSRTSGGKGLIRHGENGWLFDLEDAQPFHEALDLTLSNPERGHELARNGQELVRNEYDTQVIANRVKALYESLSETKDALRHCT